VDFLSALHRLGSSDDQRVSLADCAAVVAPYRPSAVAERLQTVGEQLDCALAHVPCGFAHGDFFTGNLLVADGRLTGVIDWDGGGPGALPLLDLLHLRHSDARSVPDDEWGPSVVESLLPWARGAVDPDTARYCAAVGFEPDGDVLEALVAAYWLDRLAYQIQTHRFRQSQQRWLAKNVDHVLDALAATTDLARVPRQVVGGGR
jgi:aminoglycoside phosphotransferase (APT) family kinase protein